MATIPKNYFEALETLKGLDLSSSTSACINETKDYADCLTYNPDGHLSAMDDILIRDSVSSLISTEINPWTWRTIENGNGLCVGVDASDGKSWTEIWRSDSDGQGKCETIGKNEPARYKIKHR